MNEITLNEAGGVMIEEEVKGRSMRTEAKAIGLVYLGFAMQAISMVLIWLFTTELKEFSDLLWGSLDNNIMDVIGTGVWAIMLVIYAASFLLGHIASLVMIKKHSWLMFFPVQFVLVILTVMNEVSGIQQWYSNILLGLVIAFVVYSIVSAIWWFFDGRRKYGVKISVLEKVLMVYMAVMMVMLMVFPAYNFELGI